MRNVKSMRKRNFFFIQGCYTFKWLKKGYTRERRGGASTRMLGNGQTLFLINKVNLSL